MSTMETPPPDTPTTPTPPGPPERYCPRCGSALAQEQEWCLACGAAADTEVVEARGWRVPLYLGGGLAALAVIGVILAIVALASSNEEVPPNSTPTPTASAVPPGATPAQTAPPLATQTPLPSTTAAPDPQASVTPDPTEFATPDATEPPNTEGGTGSTSTFPDWSGTDGWTIIIDSSTTQSGAEETATQAESDGLTGIGILNSDDYSSLNGGYYVVFSNEYTSKADAEDAAPRRAQEVLRRLRARGFQRLSCSDCGKRDRTNSRVGLRESRPPLSEPPRARDASGWVSTSVTGARHRRPGPASAPPSSGSARRGRSRPPAPGRQARRPRQQARRNAAVIPANPSSVTRQVASGSSRWASKPALISTSSGSHARISEHATSRDQRQIDEVARTAGHRQVDGEPLARTRPDVGSRPGPRIQRRLVDRHEQHVGIAVEDVVGAVAVVDVPVDDHHPLRARAPTSPAAPPRRRCRRSRTPSPAPPRRDARAAAARSRPRRHHRPASASTRATAPPHARRAAP